jgi:putative restriction endonuclease
LWTAVEAKLSEYRLRDRNAMQIASETTQDAQWLGYSGETRQKVRIGQGAFRLMVTNAYAGRCAITGESVINVLEAAHIRDYAQEGPNLVSNGLLLRADLHKLLDAGLMTVTPEHNVEIATSARGYEVETSLYNSLHGKPLLHLPARLQDHPHQQYLSWHNETRYKG